MLLVLPSGSCDAIGCMIYSDERLNNWKLNSAQTLLGRMTMALTATTTGQMRTTACASHGLGTMDNTLAPCATPPRRCVARSQRIDGVSPMQSSPHAGDACSVPYNTDRRHQSAAVWCMQLSWYVRCTCASTLRTLQSRIYCCSSNYLKSESNSRPNSNKSGRNVSVQLYSEALLSTKR